jgi:hypothetical protein
LFTTTAYNITSSGSFTLSAARAQIALIENYSGTAYIVTLPTTGNLAGDVATVRGNPSIGRLDVTGFSGGSDIVPTTGGGLGYIYDGSNWQRDPVNSHAHLASDITSGTLAHERGGLEADVSAYNGLVKIASGSTSAVTVTSAGEALLDDADAAAQRTTLELGTAAVEAATAFAASGSITTSGLTQATARILGRTSSSTGAVEEITIGSGLSLSAGELSATGGGSGGTKTYAVFTAEHNQPPATAFATLDTRNSIAVLDFDDATDESAVFVSIIPEAASLGSGLKIRLHWMATTATSGNVVWDVSLERMTTDLDSDSFDTIASGTAAANGTSGIVTVTEITLTTIDSVTAGDAFRLKVTRDANNGSDNMSNDAELVAVEVRSAA